MNILETMKQALEALRFSESMWVEHRFKPHADAQEAITNLRNAIAEIEKEEPTSSYEAYKEHKRKKLEADGFLKSPLRDEVHADISIVTPDRDYSKMTPKDCYELGLMDGAMAVRKHMAEAMDSTHPPLSDEPVVRIELGKMGGASVDLAKLLDLPIGTRLYTRKDQP